MNKKTVSGEQFLLMSNYKEIHDKLNPKYFTANIPKPLTWLQGLQSWSFCACSPCVHLRNPPLVSSHLQTHAVIELSTLHCSSGCDCERSRCPAMDKHPMQRFLDRLLIHCNSDQDNVMGHERLCSVVR